ncbi:Kinesin-like protein [Hondaea fermentalgiana]|uniref:Kinesin-like protein n=1 Tax=Hondaea fermentalgiana TaxID=2315210 RepID=A0A2R5GF58_9STRA|nr:Kinesin-like protein [Hondaea fermentalgiana]|eukprot:GBG29566.1 Kinesin-like protein [Hondaea fermentalgiana]
MATPASEDNVNVRVAVRARPLNSRERTLGCSECVSMEGKITKIWDENGKEKLFPFDHSYWYDTSQKQVYEELARPIVTAAIDGFNGVIFAYGQTGSGKTHTMQGSGDDIGIVPMLNREIFDLLAAKTEADGGESLVTASYLEIYNEVIRDLLNPSDKQLKIREHPKLGIYVEHLAELVVENAEGIAKLLDQGNAVKQVAATQMNERSSRSHCCFIVTIKQRKVEEIENGDEKITRETTLNASINLVDLAGSERAAKTGAAGSRLKEGAAINLSLSTLGQVINMLAEGGKGHIPYRNSKLTRVLQQALGGNARTVMVAAISPADNNYGETLSTLQYASRASKIQNKTVRNEDVSQRMIRELREEVERLRAQMAELERNRVADPSSLLAAGDLSPRAADAEDEQMREMREKIAMLEETKKRQWDEVQKLSAAFEEERDKTLKNENVVRDIMQNVKDEKVALMKRLRELDTEKAGLSKALKQTKAEYNETKSALEKDMAEYQATMATPEAERDEARIQELFAAIEENRDRLIAQRTDIKDMKERLRCNQEEQLEQKAELEAQTRILEEDAELRKAIQDEEKAKLREEFSESAHVMSEIANIEASYQRKLNAARTRDAEMRERIWEFEAQVVDLESDNSVLRAELSRLRAELDSVQSARKRDAERAKAREDALVKQLVQAFELDRGRLVLALEQVTKDCVHLASLHGRT